MGSTLDAFVSVDAVYLDEHFVLKSGKHSDRYINPDPIMPLPSLLGPITRQMAQPFADGVTSYLVCVGPAFGGNYLARDVACHLSELNEAGEDVFWVATRKLENGGFEIEPDRGFEHILHIATDVLLVEDLLTTGGSVERLMDSLSKYGVDWLGATVAINRGGVTAENLGVPKLFAAEELTVETDEPCDCRWCAMERPIVTDIGHGGDFQRKHPDYSGGYKELV